MLVPPVGKLLHCKDLSFFTARRREHCPEYHLDQRVTKDASVRWYLDGQKVWCSLPTPPEVCFCLSFIFLDESNQKEAASFWAAGLGGFCPNKTEKK